MNNQLTTERLEIMLAETLGTTAARGELASIEVNASIFICVLTEVLASRKAAAEPIYQLINDDWYDADRDTYEAVVRAGGRGRIVYAAPQLLTDAERTADREMLNRLAVIMSGSDTPGEIRSLTVTAQSLVERCKQLSRERGKAAALYITLPDLSSKAFWSGTGKHEVFHPETYKRWVKEAIKRDCTIAGIGVEVNS